MSEGRTRTHIMRWAPQDYRTSRVRMRSAMTSDPMLRTVYLELLNALHECGGELPADPSVLADELLLPAEEIQRCLPLLVELGNHGSRGGIQIENGVVSNARVCEDLRAAEEFRAQQAEFGSKGGVRGGKGRPKATPNRPLTDPKPTPNQPLPLPLPTPLPVVASKRPAWTSDPETNALIDTGNQCAREICDRTDGDIARLIAEVSGAGGKGKPSARLDALRGTHLQLTVRDLQARLTALKARDPAPPVDLHAERGF